MLNRPRRLPIPGTLIGCGREGMGPTGTRTTGLILLSSLHHYRSIPDPARDLHHGAGPGPLAAHAALAADQSASSGGEPEVATDLE